MASGAMITLIRNAHRHEKSVVSRPPTTGPRPAAEPAAAPQAAKAMARPRPWKVFESSAKVDGSISDAPMPSIRASPTIRLATFHETEASSDPAANSAAPTMNTRRCPYTSPRRPPIMRNVAKVSEYPVMTHSRLGNVVWNSRRIVGMATLSTVLSSTTITVDSNTMARVSHCWIEVRSPPSDPRLPSLPPDPRLPSPPSDASGPSVVRAGSGCSSGAAMGPGRSILSIANGKAT